MPFLLALRNVAFAYKVQGILHDTLSIFFSQSSRSSPDLTSGETTLQRLTYSGFLIAQLPQGQVQPTSVPLLHPTCENKTSGVETHKWKLPRSQSWDRKALTVICELPEAQWRQPVLRTPEGPNDGGNTHKIVGFTLRSSTRSHSKCQ